MTYWDPYSHALIMIALNLLTSFLSSQNPPMHAILENAPISIRKSVSCIECFHLYDIKLAYSPNSKSYP